MTFVVTAIGAILRWPRLNFPNAVVFDETYYVKDAYALLTNGFEREAVENADTLLLQGRLDLFQTPGSFIAHPPMGKWVIALGEHFYGLNSFGWRVGVAVMGTLLVLVTTRVAIRFTRSIWFGCLAGLLIAIDGLAIVMSRTALLDGIMTTFMMISLWALLLDRDYVRKRISRKPKPNSLFGGHLTWHPWRFVAGIFIGAAIATKWSALWYLAIFGLLTLIWKYSFRKLRKARRPFLAVLAVDSWWAGLQLIVPAFFVYLASWTGWIRTSDGWGRNANETGLFNTLKSLLSYHEQIWNFHINLTTTHAYQAYALGWPILLRPTSFFYEENLPNCVTDNCAMETLAIGNPLIWWSGVIALIILFVSFLVNKNWRSGTVVFLFLAGWAPWLLFSERTMFYFYSIVYLPFIVIAIAYLAQIIYRKYKDNETSRKVYLFLITVFLIAIIVLSVYFYPIWTAVSLPKDQWLMRMWFNNWI